MDVIPLDATLIKGSHGRVGVEKDYQPVLISDVKVEDPEIQPTEVFEFIWSVLHK
jgi:hypothetical protein